MVHFLVLIYEKKRRWATALHYYETIVLKHLSNFCWMNFYCSIWNVGCLDYSFYWGYCCPIYYFRTLRSLNWPSAYFFDYWYQNCYWVCCGYYAWDCRLGYSIGIKIRFLFAFYLISSYCWYWTLTKTRFCSHPSSMQSGQVWHNIVEFSPFSLTLYSSTKILHPSRLYYLINFHSSMLSPRLGWTAPYFNCYLYFVDFDELSLSYSSLMAYVLASVLTVSNLSKYLHSSHSQMRDLSSYSKHFCCYCCSCLEWCWWWYGSWCSSYSYYCCCYCCGCYWDVD